MFLPVFCGRIWQRMGMRAKRRSCKMRTSNFAISGNDINAVSIARSAPKFYKGKVYKKLAPPWWLVNKYKKDGDKEFYIAQYYESVLDKLDPQTIYNELGDDAVLLCWEPVGAFCHRRIVSEWFFDNFKIVIYEVGRLPESEGKI